MGHRATVVPCGASAPLAGATVVTPRHSPFASDPLEDTILDAIDDIPSPDFTLHVATKGKLDRAPARRDVLELLTRFIAAHDADSVIEAAYHRRSSCT